MSTANIIILLAIILVVWLLIRLYKNFVILSRDVNLDNIHEFIEGALLFNSTTEKTDIRTLTRNEGYGWDVSAAMSTLARPCYGKRLYITICHPVTDVPLISYRYETTLPRVKNDIITVGKYHQYPIDHTTKPIPFVNVVKVP